MFLLDTVTISDFAKATPNPGLRGWLKETPDALQFISVLSLGEIEAGLRGMAGGKRRRGLEAWAAGLTPLFDGRILRFEEETARVWGRTLAEVKAKGLTIPTIDLMIAATAIQHGQTVVTRNTVHFEQCGVPTLNPWT